MKRLLPWFISVLVLGGLCWAFPPIRIRSLKETRQTQAGAEPSARGFVAAFWSSRLLPATDRAADAAAVVQAISTRPQQVREQFGRTVGVSSSYFLFLRGSARVVSADTESIGLSLKTDASEADIVVPTDFVFGNAVRDATGLLDSSDYPNAQEFNEISSQLNEIVEKQVLPEFLRVATPGKRVQFAGCAEIADEQTDLKPLKLVPIDVKGE